MASGQCCKPAEQTFNQGQQHQSLGQKVSHLAASAFKREDNGGLMTECVDQSKAQSQAAICRGKSNRKSGERKKKGLLQKIKDGISGHSDDSSSSSESDNDNDNDNQKCQNKKN